MQNAPPVEIFQLPELETAQLNASKQWHAFLKRPGLLAGIYRVPTGTSDEATHKPHEQDEVYYVIRGTGTITADGVEHSLTAGTTVYVKSGVPHHFHNVREELLLLVFFPG